MTKEQFLSSGLLEQYVLGITTPEESAKVEEFIQRYPDLREEVSGMRRAIEQYALQQSIPPPPHLRKAVLEQTPAAAPGPPATEASGLAYNRFPWSTLLAGVFAVSFGLLSAFLFRANNAQQQQNQSLQVEYAMYREACEAAQQQTEELNRIYAFLTDQQTRPIRLTGTSLSPAAEAVVYWNAGEGKAMFNDISLPEPPEGKQYQLWADVEGEMINVGLLDLEPTQLQGVDYIAGAESLNITLEPLGGSEHPTVAFLYANGAI